MKRNQVFWLGLAVVLVIVGVTTAGGRSESGQPLDPDSTDGLGTRALVELLDRFGGEVTRGLPTEESTATLILADQLTAQQRGELEVWVDDGGTVIVTDPGSPLAAELVFPLVDRQDSLAAGSCSVPSLDGLVLEAGSFLLFETGDATAFCFGSDDRAYVHVVEQGRGRVVSVGGGIALTNRHLDEGDNAVLAVEILLSTATEGASVAVLYDPVIAAGSRTLSDLIPASARWGAAQLLLAGLLFIAWRSRRFGRPVAEPQPVKLPGSLLVRASAELSRRSGGFAAADRRLRHHHEQVLRQHLKVPSDLPVPELLALTSEATGLPRTTIERSLLAPQATAGSELVDLVRAIDVVQTAFHPVGEQT